MRFDPGLQPERTALSWNRTSLSIVVGGIAAVRVMPALVGPWGVALGIATIAAGVALGLLAHRRSSRTVAVLVGGPGRLPDGRAILSVAALAGLLAATASGAVICLALDG